MKTNKVVCIALAVSLAASSLAFGQGRGNSGNDRGGRGEQGDDRRNDRGNNGRGNGAYEHDRRDFGRSHNEMKQHGRGAGPGYQYYRGDRLPAEYRTRQYYVDDWRGHNLSAPPRGYQWVQSGSDYVLIALATGIIAQLLLGR